MIVYTEKGKFPKAVKFGSCLARLLLQIWNSYPAGFPIWLSKWDILDAFQRCNLRLSNGGKITYVVPPIPEDTSFLLSIDLVLPMGWLNSPEFFCAASEMVAYNANVYALDPSSTFVVYPPPPHIWGAQDRSRRNRLS